MTSHHSPPPFSPTFSLRVVQALTTTAHAPRPQLFDTVVYLASTASFLITTPRPPNDVAARTPSCTAATEVPWHARRGAPCDPTARLLHRRMRVPQKLFREQALCCELVHLDCALTLASGHTPCARRSRTFGARYRYQFQQRRLQ